MADAQLKVEVAGSVAAAGALAGTTATTSELGGSVATPAPLAGVVDAAPIEGDAR